MPKKSKKMSNKAPSNGRGDLSDDDSAYNDNASVISQTSDGSFLKDEGFGGGEDGAALGGASEELGQNEAYEEKLMEAIDMATQKSANGRVNALEGLCKAFSKKYLPEFIQDRYVTLCDIVERALKKGKANEQIAAANLSAHLCVQLGLWDSSLEIFKTLKPVLTQIVNDGSSNLKVRAAVISALGSICFIADADIAEILEIMGICEKGFLQSCKEKPDTNTEILAFHTSALSAWTLLLTMIPSSHAYKMLESHMEHLGILLDSPDVDLRITAGEAIVVLFENAADYDEDEAYDAVSDLIPILTELSKDSKKSRSKKDRKEQRSSFRDIVKYIDEGTDYKEKLSINTRESLTLNSWFKKKHYDSLCKILSSGINHHLTENEMVREVFELGAPIPDYNDLTFGKPSKQQRHLVNSQAFKFRTKTRGKERDKRSAIH